MVVVHDLSDEPGIACACTSVMERLDIAEVHGSMQAVMVHVQETPQEEAKFYRCHGPF